MTIWIEKENNVNIKKMSESMGVSEVMATALANRGIIDEISVEQYISPNVGWLRDTLEFKGVKEAFEILFEAKRENSKIFIYGDYDADGVTSTAILYKMLKIYGASVEYYIPDRVTEGYGLNLGAVQVMADRGCKVLFTCDNGITSIEEVKLAKMLGIKVIILDHHEPAYEMIDGEKTDILPDADAIIDAKQKDCNYKFKMLCAGGMSFKFAKAFFEYANIEKKHLNEFVVLGGIATVCDIVDLLDENRVIAKNSLKVLNLKKDINLGLGELIDVCGLADKKITEYHYGFVIGPCINASGRLDLASHAVELLITDDREKARALAEKLFLLNNERKAMTESSVEKSLELVENTDLKNDKVLVIYDNEVHESIVGIVAGKIKEKYYKPTIVLTDGESSAKGSARSIEKYDLFENLQMNKDILGRFGGHTMAAGLNIEKENIELLRKRLNDNCILSDEDMTPVTLIDMELRFRDIYINLIEELNQMMPFGKGNAEPIFSSMELQTKWVNFVGANKNIIQLSLVDKENIETKGIIFDKYEQFIDKLKEKYNENDIKNIIEGKNRNVEVKMDIVYKLGINEYKGVRSTQLIIKDIK